ncbi:MAG: hydantoinase B/oxoprolinase family protein, partial [Alphaproteobacteria bacterium]|nr:hydantoinase B/oxoprolinase family protein [Alphaproteobacteria bacterium]
SVEGTVNNCAYPAPCAMATISGVIVTIDAAWRCLSQMLLASDNHRDEAMAVWSGTSMAPIFAGTSQHGFPFAATEMSHFGGGGGARTYADGVDTSGIVFNTTPNMPNIEDQESEYPVLYLYRRHLCDSGGPGQFRGGRSGELAYTVYDAPNDDLVGLFAGTGAEMPNGIGVAGGMPGNAIRIGRFLGTDVPERLANGTPLPERLEDIGGHAEVMASKHERGPIATGDVWHHCWQAGGGYGDPLLREGAAVALDVARGAVSREAARDIYGIVLTKDGAVDAEGTQAQRERIRRDRLAAAVPIEAGDAVMSFPGANQLEFGDALVVDGAAGSVVCGHCGHRHCATDDNLLDHLREIQAPLTAAGPVRGEDYDVGRFHLRQLCCANCATLVDVQVALDGAPRPFMQIGIP